MVDGVISCGEELHLTDNVPALVKLAGLISTNVPSPTVETVETTDQESGCVRTFLPGLTDPGELSFTIKYVPLGADDTLIREHLNSKEVRPFKIVALTETAGSTVDITGDIMLTGYEIDETDVGELRTATVTAQISGAVTYAATP